MRVQAGLAALAAAVLFAVASGAAQSSAGTPPPPGQTPPAPSAPAQGFAAPPADDPSSKCPPLPGTYSAQKKPRIAVMPFVDTNEAAAKQRYGASVSAMLVTFLKRKSQFVVVERDSTTLDDIAAELARVGSGATDQSASAKVQLTAFDALLQGQVTLIGDEKNPRVEVDARLLGMDAKIVSVSNKSGAIGDLRSVVERLGVDLEQGFLRPYYGSLSVTVPEPSNVRVFLTPVLWECAKPDEKPPIELRGFVPTGDQAKFRRWRTQPNVATIDNLLAGWYTIRFERPGYDGVGPNSADNARLEVISNFGEPRPMTRMATSELREPSAQQSRFLVQIRPLAAEQWPKQGAFEPLKKRAGSVRLMVKREFLDQDYRDAAEIPELVSILESINLALNDEADLVADGDHEAVANDGKRSLSKTCGVYSFAQARPGQQLVIKDYHKRRPEDRELPVGSYRVAVGLPQYVVKQQEVDVQNGVANQAVMIDLKRAVGSIRIARTGDPRRDYHLYFEGRDTKFSHKLPLDFAGDRDMKGYEPAIPTVINNLPLDSYRVYNDIPGFKTWNLDVQLVHEQTFEPLKLEDRECKVSMPEREVSEPKEKDWVYLAKAQPWLAGALTSGMRAFSDPNLLDRPQITALLNQAMLEEEKVTKKPDVRPGQKGRSTPGALQPRRPEPDILVAPVSKGADNSPEAWLAALRRHLGQIDLLYLTDADTLRLAGLPRVAGVIREYIEKGGAVFALVSSPADYSSLFGAAIPLGKATLRDEIEVRPGSTPGLQLDIKVELLGKREFPTVLADKKQPLTGWRAVAYRKKGQKEPAVLELGVPDSGGYALVWLDKLDELHHPIVREALAAAEKRAITWSQHHMFRRYGQDTVESRTARERMNTLVFTARGEAKKGS